MFGIDRHKTPACLGRILVRKVFGNVYVLSGRSFVRRLGGASWNKGFEILVLAYWDKRSSRVLAHRNWLAGEWMGAERWKKLKEEGGRDRLGRIPAKLTRFLTYDFGLWTYKLLLRTLSSDSEFCIDCSTVLMNSLRWRRRNNSVSLDAVLINLLKPSGNFTYHQV
jgi:hypothetical protein